MNTSRRELLHLALATAAGSLPLISRAQAIETVKILTGFAAGGTVDTLARRVATQLNSSYAKPLSTPAPAPAGRSPSRR